MKIPEAQNSIGILIKYLNDVYREENLPAYSRMKEKLLELHEMIGRNEAKGDLISRLSLLARMLMDAPPNNRDLNSKLSEEMNNLYNILES